MKLFGFTIVTNNTMDVIIDKAVSAGHFEDKIHDLQNRVDTLKVHKKTLMGDRERFEGECERTKAYNGTLRDENTVLKREKQELIETGGKGIARMATKIRARDESIEARNIRVKDQAAIIGKLKVENKKLEARREQLIDTIRHRGKEIERITKHDERSTKLFNNISMAVVRMADDVKDISI